jgi:hypothetical protein
MMLSTDRTNVAWWSESGVKAAVFKSLVFHLNGVYFLVEKERALKALLLGVNLLALGAGIWSMRRDKRLVFLAMALLLPLALNLAYSLLVSPILGNAQSAGRYFLLTLPPYLILLARGWQVLFERPGAPRRLGVAAFALFLVLYLAGLRAMETNDRFWRDDNRRLCAMLFEKARPGDVVLAYPVMTLEYYAARLGFKPRGIAVLAMTRRDRELPSALPPRPPRVWLFFDPAHRFAWVADALCRRFALSIVLEEKERRMSGVSLILLDRPSGSGRAGSP